MEAVEVGHEIMFFHPVLWAEPFRAIITGFEYGGRAIVRTLQEIHGADGAVLYYEGQELTVGLEYVFEGWE